jgi:tetratricopeptide (TPR) repeat protein
MARSRLQKDMLDTPDWLQLSTDRLLSGDYAQALVAAERYRTLQPQDKVGAVCYAKVLTQLGCYHEAEQELMRLEPCTEPKLLKHYLVTWIELCHDQGRVGDEERWSRRLIDEFRDCASGYNFLGRCLRRQGKVKESEDTFRLGTKCEGAPEEAYYNLGRVLAFRKQFHEAQEAFRQALAIDPAYTAAQQALQDVWEALKLERMIEIEGTL